MNIEELMAKMQAIMDAAEGRDLSDDEVAQYEQLEVDLLKAQKTQNLRDKHQAYNTVVVPAGVPSRGVRKDDGRTDQDRAFENFLRTGVPNADISDLYVDHNGNHPTYAPMNAQGSGTTAGGYMVPSGFRTKLVEVRKSFGGFANLAETITTDTGGPLEYPTIDDTANSGGITAESAAITSGNDLVFGTVTLGAYKYTSAGTGSNLALRVPVELLQDAAFDVESLVARKLGERIARKQASDWMIGTGSSQPLGVAASSLTADNELDTPDTVDYDDIMDTYDLLDEAYEANATWVMRKNTWSQIRGIVDTAGRPIVQNSLEGIAGAPQKMLLGFPVVIDQATPLLSSAADGNAILFGDFREAYVIRRVSNLVVVVNPYSRATNGEVEFSAWERADGNIQNRGAYVICQNNT